MLTPRQILRRLRDIARGRRLDADVDDEVRFHIEMQAASLVAQGMSPGRARAKAQSDFGAGRYARICNCCWRRSLRCCSWRA